MEHHPVNNTEANDVVDTGSGVQTGGGGVGMRLGIDQAPVGGQAVVEGYNQEQAVCGGWGEGAATEVVDAGMQVGGGGSPFDTITDPKTGQSFSIFSAAGKALLKSYVKAFNMYNLVAKLYLKVLIQMLVVLYMTICQMEVPKAYQLICVNVPLTQLNQIGTQFS